MSLRCYLTLHDWAGNRCRRCGKVYENPDPPMEQEQLALSDLAEVINKLHAKANDRELRKDIDDDMAGLDCGQYLEEARRRILTAPLWRPARSRLQQHEWQAWIRDHVAFDMQTAEWYIRHYRQSW